MATSRKGSGTSTAKKAGGKGKKLMSAKTASQFALNDLLSLHADDTETPEVLNARRVLKDNGFTIRPSRQQEIEKIKTEVQAIDASEAGAAATMIDLGKRLSAAQRGKVVAAKKTE
jgi:hypothetical protein